jgi:hypothetical protein
MEVWDQQPGESPRAYHAFAHYRDLGVGRSLDKAWRAHKTVCEQQAQIDPKRRALQGWKTWSVRFGWVIRSEAWDRDVDVKHRTKAEQIQADARERHARLAQGALAALTVPVRATLDAMQQPNMIASLTRQASTDAASFLAMVTIVARVASSIPALVAVERTALGMGRLPETPPDAVPHDGVAARIAEDPVATELAIALLDRLAGTGDRHALGAAVARDARDVRA